MQHKGVEYTAYYRNFLKDLIVNIKGLVPENAENRSLLIDLNSTLGSLWYQAPELLNNTLHRVLNILKTYIPLSENANRT